MRKLLKILLFLLLILLSYLLVINLLPDEELSAGAKEWLQPEPVTVSKEENSYYLLWGLDAPVGVDMREYGEAVVTKLPLVKGWDFDDDVYSHLKGYGNDLRINGSGLSDLCKMSEEFCLERYQRKSQELLTKGDNALLLKRYRKMVVLLGYQSVIPLRTETIPLFSPLMDGQRLSLLSITADYLNGKREKALYELAIDLRFSRMLVARADNLIVKMVAMKMVAEDLHLYSQFIGLDDAGAVLVAIKAVTPLSKDERDFSRVLKGELRFHKSILKDMNSPSYDDIYDDLYNEDFPEPFILRKGLPVRVNRNINRSHAYMEMILKLSDLGLSQFVESAADHELGFQSNETIWDVLYDPLFTVFWLGVQPEFSQYLIRDYDINALIRLLKLKAEIISNNVSAEKLDAFIAASPYAHAYPEEASPIRWDPGAQALTYDSVRNPKERDLYTHIFFRVD